MFDLLKGVSCCIYTVDSLGETQCEWFYTERLGGANTGQYMKSVISIHVLFFTGSEVLITPGKY